jgi:hypothetical protein
MASQVLSESEFAKAVGTSTRTLQRLRRAGRIQYRRIGWRIYYLVPDDIDCDLLLAASLGALCGWTLSRCDALLLGEVIRIDSFDLV